MTRTIEIRALAKDDDRKGFSCGQPDLDRFFELYAGQNQFKLHLTVTYLALAEARIVGFATDSMQLGTRASAPGIQAEEYGASRTGATFPMTHFWQNAFTQNQLMWGSEPTASARYASDSFAKQGVKEVLIPGIGYGRNARPFLDRGMSVTGIEISETAIALARSQLGLECPIHHGSVEEMPFEDKLYDGIFCYALIHLLDADARRKLIEDCWRQLAPGGRMIFTLISKQAPMYGQGTRIGDDWYERMPNLRLYFYDAESVEREFGSYGLVEVSQIDEPAHGGALPFFIAVCQKS